MATQINLNNTTPTAPTNGQNVFWQSDASSPTNVSAYIDLNSVTTQVLINFAGSVYGDGNFTYNPTTKTVLVNATSNPGGGWPATAFTGCNFVSYSSDGGILDATLTSLAGISWSSATGGFALGGQFTAVSYGTHNVQEILGLSSVADHATSGTIVNIIAAEFGLLTEPGSGAVTNAYGLLYNTPIYSGTAGVAYSSAVEIENQWSSNLTAASAIHIQAQGGAANGLVIETPTGTGFSIKTSSISIQDSAIAGGTVTHSTRVVTISAAHLNNLYTTPIQLLPAPGTNLTYIINNVLTHYTYTTSAFTLNSATELFLQFTSTGSGGVTPIYGVALLAGLTDQTHSGYEQGLGGTSGIMTTSLQVNQALYITNDVANMSGGGGTVTLIIDYSIIDTTQTGTAV